MTIGDLLPIETLLLLQRDGKLFDFKWKVAPEVPLQVQLDTATVGKIVRTVAAPGQVEAEFQVEISSQVPGRIERMPARGEAPSEFRAASSMKLA